MSDAEERLTEADRSIAEAKRRTRPREAATSLIPPRPRTPRGEARITAAVIDVITLAVLAIPFALAAWFFVAERFLTPQAAAAGTTWPVGGLANAVQDGLVNLGVTAGMVVLAVVTGGSLGKRAMGLCVVPVDPASSPAVRRAAREALRWLPLVMAGVGNWFPATPAGRSIRWGLLALGYAHFAATLWAVHRRRRAWYDYVAGTVIKSPVEDLRPGFAVVPKRS